VAALFEPEVVEPTVTFLAELAGTGAALEFGVGTGRIAIPLSQRGIRVHGIDLSAAMIAQLQASPGSDRVGVTIGDFATTRAEGTFRLGEGRPAGNLLGAVSLRVACRA
jgi:predicted TPR repeat methyltransferase